MLRLNEQTKVTAPYHTALAMAKYNTRSTNIRYRYPLPLHPVVDSTSELPHLIIHNPISWIHWIYKYYQVIYNKTNLCKKIDITIRGGDQFPHIMVKDSDGMKYLWENGFFGTGTLSRSEPTWYERMSLRQTDGEDPTNGNNTLSALEQVTKRRRLERLEFKKLREKFEQELLDLKKIQTDEESINALLLRQREQLREFKQTYSSSELLSTTTTEKDHFDPQFDDDDLGLFDSNGDLIPLESLELMPVEAIFLTFALPVINITPLELFQKLQMSQYTQYGDNFHSFIIQYVVYHYYRSRGWCVRSGIKFGCDYLLYKRGPPFQHAEFCINVMDCHSGGNTKDYTWYSRQSRVISGAKKIMVLTYVNRKVSSSQIMEWWSARQYHKVFHSYEINEIIYKRWVPGKNRD